ncbi:MAG: sugar phosphate isomerase/epimerase [Oscillospiraceae bacterium]|nr:sugar phosphate isomerase/epimerase [Oscillospiraceae bacterium]
MLKIAISDGGGKRFDPETRLRMIADAGFDGVDAGVLANLMPRAAISEMRIPPEIADEASLVRAAVPHAELIRQYGLEIFQAHAPYPAVRGDEEFDEKLWEIFAWSIRACDAIGCRKLVFHPPESTKNCKLTAEQEIELTMARFPALIDAAKQYGVTVCIESMYCLRENHLVRQIMEAPTADPDTMCGLIDELNRLAGEEVFGFCLDTGHTMLYGKDFARLIPRIGSRLKALHIHDNDGNRDQHLAPYMGVLQWDRFVEGVAATDYAGALSFETNGVWKQFDPELLPTILRYIAEAGRLFARRIEERRTSC